MDKLDERHEPVQSRYEMGLLFDFYGQLLSDRQQEAMDMHFNQDMSLAEIADELKITRQAAHDAVRKGKLALAEFEERLGLLSRFRDQDTVLHEILTDLKTLAEAPGMNTHPTLMHATERLGELLDRL